MDQLIRIQSSFKVVLRFERDIVALVYLITKALDKLGFVCLTFLWVKTVASELKLETFKVQVELLHVVILEELVIVSSVGLFSKSLVFGMEGGVGEKPDLLTAWPVGVFT